MATWSVPRGLRPSRRQAWACPHSGDRLPQGRRVQARPPEAKALNRRLFISVTVKEMSMSKLSGGKVTPAHDGRSYEVTCKWPGSRETWGYFHNRSTKILASRIQLGDLDSPCTVDWSHVVASLSIGGAFSGFSPVLSYPSVGKRVAYLCPQCHQLMVMDRLWFPLINRGRSKRLSLALKALHRD